MFPQVIWTKMNSNKRENAIWVVAAAVEVRVALVRLGVTGAARGRPGHYLS